MISKGQMASPQLCSPMWYSSPFSVEESTPGVLKGVFILVR